MTVPSGNGRETSESRRNQNLRSRRNQKLRWELYEQTGCAPLPCGRRRGVVSSPLMAPLFCDEEWIRTSLAPLPMVCWSDHRVILPPLRFAFEEQRLADH